jgi:hypothetical protein
MTRRVVKEKDLPPVREFYGDKVTAEYAEALVSSVREDFDKRAQERKPLEAQWQLNMNFLAGRQYMRITSLGELEEMCKEYEWQSREVFNHIAPLIETRLAKLTRVRPRMSVRAVGDEESDLQAAKLATKILDSCHSTLNLEKLIAGATMWSEVTGTAFYKVEWDSFRGRILGKSEGEPVFEGDVSIAVCPPFEIFPENLYEEEVEKQRSIICAKAVHVDTIEEVWGQRVEAEEIDAFTLERRDGLSCGRKSLEGYALVIEKYELPTRKYPDGRVIIVAGNKLLHLSELPYLNGERSGRAYPLIKQCSVNMSGSFFGISIIERCIPIQRAYNVVKNRKHEFMNRLAAGVLAVEDGSTDIEQLEDEGLPPGKVIIYKQGSRPPQMLSPGHVPIDFTYEEERLLHEFKLLSGVSDVMRNSSTTADTASGVALQLLIEQDDTRLSAAAENIRLAVREIGKHIIRLYRQYAGKARLLTCAGENNAVEQIYFSSSSLTSDDVYFETENEFSLTPAQRRTMIMDMLKIGLLSDENGRISQRTKARVADLLGFSTFDNGQDLVNLNIKRALKENLLLFGEALEPLEIDDHEVHIQEHVKYMLSGEFERHPSGEKSFNFLSHIRLHKALLGEKEEAGDEQ